MKKGVKNLDSPINEARFNKIISDIKSVKIQGANNIALAGIEAFLLFNDKSHIKKIISSRPTEPLLQNFIKILLRSSNVKKTAVYLKKYIENSQKKINIIGSTLIKDDMKIFSHCHSSSVIQLLKYAKKQKKKFTVYTAEVEPLLQGRKTARELAKAGIRVIVMPDLSSGHFLKKCDIFFFGADAYTKKFVYNKIGTETLAYLASLYKIPSYSIGVSLKYSSNVKLEKRDSKEVWNQHNPNISVENLAFDALNRRYLTGVISEYGITHYDKFIRLARLTLKNLSRLP